MKLINISVTPSTYLLFIYFWWEHLALIFLLIYKKHNVLSFNGPKRKKQSFFSDRAMKFHLA